MSLRSSEACWAFPISDVVAEDADKRTPEPDSIEESAIRRLNTVAELPDDPVIPALLEIRAACLAGVFPPRCPGVPPGELLVHSYKPGKRIAIEVRIGRRRFAVKAYASDPVLEAELYEALTAAGLAGDSMVRVPPLLAWDRNLQVVVIGWLEGPTAQELVQRGQGERAGELAACCGGETGTARRCYRAALPGSSGSSFPRGHRQTACWPFCPSR